MSNLDQWSIELDTHVMSQNVAENNREENQPNIVVDLDTIKDRINT